MLQTTILYSLIGCVLVLGTLSNIIYIGVIEATLYVIAVLVGAYYIISEIKCVVYGKCYIYSWIRTIIAAIAFGSLGFYYLLVLLKKHTIRDMKSQPIMENPYVSSAVHDIQKFTGFDLASYLKF